MSQERIPFAPPRREWALLSHDTLVDYAGGTLTPCRFDVLPRLLATITRYGPCSPLETHRKCSVLIHSTLVGRIARQLWLDYVDADDEAGADAVAIFGAMHDVGEIFGGDVEAVVPPQVKVLFKEYQDRCRRNVTVMLGLPLPNEQQQVVIKAADLLSLIPEIHVMGIGHVPFSMEGGWDGFIERVIARCPALEGASTEALQAVAWSAWGWHKDGFPPFRKARSHWLELVRQPVIFLSDNDYRCMDVASSREMPPAWLLAMPHPHHVHDLGKQRQKGVGVVLRHKGGVAERIWPEAILPVSEADGLSAVAAGGGA